MILKKSCNHMHHAWQCHMLPRDTLLHGSDQRQCSRLFSFVRQGHFLTDLSIRRKVPESASHKGDEEYAVGANCKAGDPCSICHTEFAVDEEVSQLPCEHCFHESCIKPWLEVQNTCPICRAVLPGTEARAENSGATMGQQQPGASGLGPLPQGQNLININELTQNLFGGQASS